MTDTSKNKVYLAKIGKTRGLRGQVRIAIYNPDSDLFISGKVFHISDSLEFKNLTITLCDGNWCTFDEIQNVDDAKKITNKELYLYREELPKPKKGFYYHIDLVGCSVSTSAGEKIGILKNILYTASNDVWVIEQANGEEMMLPILHKVIDRIDIEQNSIFVNIPETV